ncbi:hypothetical protein DO97_06305 [Neosynechococcus sphagnicola sy1]|uniref:Uncharacterized protein n=1 Tax=Neosynechococcus sphagnicola sy1 TaxID=1497020 RepID=A0A098TT37_9CYAN|nr:hypothetical protein [Neosynechococcus sphagnicola]KGF73943.1 hypothetical protein DO97_06305 [Neosynechococcus sphagnicola sy1]
MSSSSVRSSQGTLERLALESETSPEPTAANAVLSAVLTSGIASSHETDAVELHAEHLMDELFQEVEHVFSEGMKLPSQGVNGASSPMSEQRSTTLLSMQSLSATLEATTPSDLVPYRSQPTAAVTLHDPYDWMPVEATAVADPTLGVGADGTDPTLIHPHPIWRSLDMQQLLLGGGMTLIGLAGIWLASQQSHLAGTPVVNAAASPPSLDLPTSQPWRRSLF